MFDTGPKGLLAQKEKRRSNFADWEWITGCRQAEEERAAEEARLFRLIHHKTTTNFRVRNARADRPRFERSTLL